MTKKELEQTLKGLVFYKVLFAYLAFELFSATVGDYSMSTHVSLSSKASGTNGTEEFLRIRAFDGLWTFRHPFSLFLD